MEQVPGSGIPFGLLEPGQVSDEEDDVTGIHIGADGSVGFAGVEERGQRLADRASSQPEALATWARTARLVHSEFSGPLPDPPPG